jgi:acetyl-CoA carboxylase biotin carboxylase subunit
MYGVRIETGYAQGQEVTPFYDAMLAKIIGFGDTREMAIGRLCVALQAFSVEGVRTNASLLRKILQAPQFLGGQIDTSIVEDIMGVR